MADYYIMNLDWGDGSPEEFTDGLKPLYDGLDVFDHVYEKPGFYIVTGLVFQNQDDDIKVWEKFKSNIIVNQSDSYDSPFFNNENFAIIGGYSEKSAYFKTMLMLAGYNFDKEMKTSITDLKEYNEFDKINILNTIIKFDNNLYNTYLDNYTDRIYDGQTLIHNNYVSKKYGDILKTTDLNNVDVGSCKVYNGVQPMWKQLGFQNDDSGSDWNNIIPKKWNWVDKEGIEYDVFREPTSGSKALVDEFEEYTIDESATQDWVDSKWPALPKINKVGIFMNDTGSDGHFVNQPDKRFYGSKFSWDGDDILAPITNLNEVDDDLVLNIDFNQDTVDNVVDRTSQFEIIGTFDFTVGLDDAVRVEKKQKDNVELLMKKNTEQAF
jgi:hypothetical protein